jgi:hypothetical protein
MIGNNMSILKDLLALKQPVEAIVEGEDIDGEELEQLADHLEELHEKMVKTMSEVREIVRMLPRSYRGAAEAYWIPHIMIALGGEHEWMTAGHESTMEKMIKEMREEAEAQNAHDEHGGDDDEDYKNHGNDPMGSHHGRNY